MIYFDHAATTKVDRSVIDAISSGFDIFGNPSSSYDIGLDAKKRIDLARHNIESTLSIPNNSFIFTSGGTESDNFAIKTSFLIGKKLGRTKIIVSSVEHSAILRACESMKSLGATICKISVLRDGSLNFDDLAKNLDNSTAIVSIMLSNNETGTMMDINRAAQMAHAVGAMFHTDAVHGITHCPQMIVNNHDIDMFSISGHKFGAPKGIGGLYINPTIQRAISGSELISGGKQEFGIRGGTENTPYILGLDVALKKHISNIENAQKQIRALGLYVINKLHEEFPYATVNGIEGMEGRNPGTISIALHKVDASSVVEWMNLHNIFISSGSACNTGSHSPSHVLTSMGLSEKDAFSSIRLSFSQENTIDEIDTFFEILHKYEKIYIH